MALDVADVLDRLGAERQENFDTPQVVRDILRIQADRLRKSVGETGLGLQHERKGDER